MQKIFDWELLQKEYDSGLSQKDLARKYQMSTRTIILSAKKGILKMRSKSEAAKLDAKKHPRKHTEEFKEQQRRNILKRYEEGWMPKAGRSKKFLYESSIAGSVYVDGTWELKVAQWLDINVKFWSRNTKRFEYFDTDKRRYYTPDFWIEDWDSYLEVKGYETKLDRCKWSQFADPLIIWKRKELEERNII